MKIIEFDARDFDGPEVFAAVTKGDIGVIHNAISEQDAVRAVDAALAWSKIEPAFDTKGGTVSPPPRENFHRIDNNPALSKTKHIFHTFNLEAVKTIPGVEGAAMTGVFDMLVEIDNKLMGKRGNLSPAAEGANFHPQIIHYPKGGGFFDQHRHSFEPQKIGLIASLTKRVRILERAARCSGRTAMKLTPSLPKRSARLRYSDTICRTRSRKWTPVSRSSSASQMEDGLQFCLTVERGEQ